MKTETISISKTKQLVLLISFIVLLAGLIHTSQVYAHATLTKSEPPRRASLSVPPKHIQLWFNEEIEGSYASISVIDSDENSITDAVPELVPDDLKSVVLPIPELNPGRYTVQYRVLSVDGHVVESSFGFMVKK
jgi:methionine-rich copper-binding protein CopC